MKAFFYLSSALALLFTVNAPNARSQDNAAAASKPMHLTRGTPQGNLIQFVAATIVFRRELESVGSVSHQASSEPQGPALSIWKAASKLQFSKGA
jgi:hypothetical protein